MHPHWWICFFLNSVITFSYYSLLLNKTEYNIIILRLFSQRSSHWMTLESQNKWLGQGLFTSIYAFGANPK